MSLDVIKDQLPDYARDLKLNLGSVLTPQGAPGLTERQIAAVALSTAIASRNPALTQAIEAWAKPQLDDAHVNAARAAAAIMGMNNIYYRFLHLVEDGEYQTMPARLRMNVIGKPRHRQARFRAVVAGRFRGQWLRTVRDFAREEAARGRGRSRSDTERGANCIGDPRGRGSARVPGCRLDGATGASTGRQATVHERLHSGCSP